MKKITAIFLSVLILCSGAFVGVYATEDFSVNIAYDLDENMYYLSGTLTTNKANIPMVLTVFDPSGEFYTGFQALSQRGEENSTFSFPPLSFPYDASTGTYKLKISSELYAYTPEYPVYVMSTSDKYHTLKDFNSCIENDGEGLYDLAKSKAFYLNLNSENMNLDANSQDVFNTFIKTPYNVSETFTVTPEEIEQIETEWVKCSRDSFRALAAAALADIKDITSCATWINMYYASLELNKENPDTAYKEEKIDKYFIEVQTKYAFVKRISSISTITDMDDLKDKLYEAVLLSAIETMGYTAVSDIFSSFSQLFPVNTDTKDKLTSTELGNIYTKMAGQSYADYEAAADAFDDLAKAQLDARDDDDNDSGRGGGGRVGSSVIYTPTPSEETSEAPEAQDGFQDLYLAEWAREAIVTLADKNIIQGHSESIFAPNDAITRAEFIAIVVRTLGLSLEGNISTFADVDISSWYYDEVAAAQKASIIYGDENNRFNPDMTISRQDMATILHRAFRLECQTEDANFADFNTVSEYAKSAVSVLSNNGIINGMGDGNFAPFDNATRAQAAQMIYKILCL